MEYGKIYKITNDVNTKIYIGSSTYQYLSSRMNLHRQMCKDVSGRRNTVLYNTMREIGVSHFKIELIEKYTCNTKQELVEREQYWIEQLQPELNMFRAIANPNYEKECRNKKERCKKSNEYYHSHKEQIKAQYSEKNTCECGVIGNRGDRARHLKTLFHINYLANIV
jgi:group I intron endonuclease